MSGQQQPLASNSLSADRDNRKPSKIDDSTMAKFEEIIAEYQAMNDCGDAQHISTESSSKHTADCMLQFLCLIGRLKLLPRRGWTIENRNISNVEPIAGHMYRMAIMAMVLDAENDDDCSNDPSSQIHGNTVTHLDLDLDVLTPPLDANEYGTGLNKRLDIDKMIKMSLIHDMAECIVGDVTPNDRVTEEEKHRSELDSIKNLVSLLPKKASQRLFSLYKEYESRQSPEALMVKELDRFDLCLQAFQYEQQEYWNHDHLVKFDKFFKVAQQHCKHPLLKQMIDNMMEKRAEFWNNRRNLNGIVNVE